MRVLARWIWRDDRLTTSLIEPVAQLACIVGTISDQPFGRRDAAEEFASTDQVMGLAGRDSKGNRPTGMVAQGVNFGRPSAARSADGVLEVPPFAPAAERCALTWVESIAVVETTPLEPLKA